MKTNLGKNRPLILVADDEENDIKLLEMSFERLKLDCSVDWVRDGVEAIDYLRKATEDEETPRLPLLFLLDVNMPRLDGHEVLHWVRAQPSLRRLIVVMFTTSDQPVDIERAYDEGANSFLLKPTDFNELLPRMRCFVEYWFEHNVLPSYAQQQRRRETRAVPSSSPTHIEAGAVR